ncbi:MAG: 50S ribosomal protein L15 [Patescibacteria group bacterium]|nr:50S ribosomal protein L15 [Patescibacteria group bacterium]
MILQVNTIKPARGSKHSPKKIGRGNASGHGNYSGHGGKGQTARSGGSHGLRLKAFKRLMQSTPKLGGFKSLKIKPAEVYLSDLEKHYQAGDVVNLASLKEKGIIKNNAKAAKIISNGELTKKITIEGLLRAKSVEEKIKSLGGEIK